MSSVDSECDSSSGSSLVHTDQLPPHGVAEPKADWKAALPLAELCIAEHILANVTTKLRYFLPPEIVGKILERQRERTQISQDGIDSSILRDVLLQDFRQQEQKTATKATAEQDTIVHKALEKLIAETSAWEQDEETAAIGFVHNDFLFHQHEHSEALRRDFKIPSLRPRAQRRMSRRSSSRMARQGIYRTQSEDPYKTKKSDGAQNYQELTEWMNAERKKAEALMEDMRHQMKVAEGEGSEITARVLVEKEYIKDCTELTNAYEYWNMELKENEAEKEEAYQKAFLLAIPNATESATAMYEKLLDDLDRWER
ncbi:hypothetical protein RvY_13268 [Ramazzottius varieornatus]|uniref:Uncharacterized protein n=1 Tax=Ramazzottius varieornatus TaxID=947166 RepID=A0A1D1VP57_RAMVA|nr:hypothetical protein RvY_13268 [Ramazzottius varieornatus]